jgi:ATP-dependent DNA helicase RecQ
MVNSALSVLSLEGYIGLTEGVYLPSRLKFLLENDNLYDYQVRNPAYDPFIKTILRSYEGVFDEFRKISETEISRRSNISMEKTLQYLKNLHKEQVLHYIPSSDSPKITFLIPRQDSKNLVLYTENLRKRRESYISGIKTMLEYVQNKNTCRNRFILHYFGEDETNNCGICDVCLGAPGDGEKESGMLRAAILSHLKAQSLSLKDLVGCLDAYEPETVIKIVRWMVDRGELKYRDGNHLVPVSRGES